MKNVFNKIHDCVGKASSTAANQDHVTANSHQLSFSFDPALNTAKIAHANCSVGQLVNISCAIN